MIFTTWILWAIIQTTNPNVNSFVVVGEYEHREQCVALAQALAETGIPLKAPQNVTEVSVICIPVATRIPHAN